MAEPSADLALPLSDWGITSRTQNYPEMAKAEGFVGCRQLADDHPSRLPTSLCLIVPLWASERQSGVDLRCIGVPELEDRVS
jgi:hypothetical protein